MDVAAGNRGCVRVLGCGLVLALAAMSAQAGDLLTFNTKARVTIDAQGRPTAVDVPSELPTPVAEFVERQILQWRFQAPTIEGQPQGGQTWVTLGACAAPVANGYQLAVDYKGTGPGATTADGLLPPPAYPPAAARAGRMAKTRVNFIVETDGTTTFESAVMERDGGKTGVFETPLRTWVESLRFDPEVIDGRQVRTRMTLPVEFLMGAGPAPRERNANKAECKTAMKRDDDQRPMALDSPFKRIETGS